MTTFHGENETKLCQTELTYILRYQMIARALFRAVVLNRGPQYIKQGTTGPWL